MKVPPALVGVSSSRRFILLVCLFGWSALSRSNGQVSGTFADSSYVPSITANVPICEIPNSNPLKAAITGTPSEQTYALQGFLDITKPPYNASTTSADNSAAINQAVFDAYSYNFVVFFPAGTYNVAHQISCSFLPPPPLNGNLKFCNVLVGSTGAGSGRSVIHYTGTDSPAILFQYLTTGSSGTTPDAMSQYGSTFRDIDIDMEGAATADAISMEGAQNCDIENITISGTFHAGIDGLPGSGGSINDVTINGGQIGVLSDSYRPNPVLSGLTLNGQSISGLQITNSRGPVCLVGFSITNTNASGSYNAISGTLGGNTQSDPKADMSLLDGTITISGTNSIAIANAKARENVAIRNVFIKAAKLVQSGAFTLTGTPTSYTQVQNYVFVSGSTRDTWLDYDNDRVVAAQLTTGTSLSGTTVSDPTGTDSLPADLVSRHVATEAPSWQDAGSIFDVTATNPEFSGTATPDDPTHDQSSFINNAIIYASDTGKKAIFLPRGHYYIQNPITSKPGVAIIGAGKNISILALTPSATSAWASVGTGTDTLLTIASGTQGNILQDFGILGVFPSATTSSPTAPTYLAQVTMLDVQNSQTTFRDVVVNRRGDPTSSITGKSTRHGVAPVAPVVLLENTAGGKFYDLSLYTFTSDTDNTLPPYPTDSHLLLIRDTRYPLYVYSPSIEHYTVSGAMAELDNAQNVHFIGLKAEGSHQLLQVTDSLNCSVFGSSGNLSSGSSSCLIQASGYSDRLWFSELDRLVQDTSASPWVTSGSYALSGSNPVALYRQGPLVVTEPGVTETFSGTSDFSDLNPTYYSYGTDAAGHPCLNFSGPSGATPQIHCDIPLLDPTKPYEVSVKVRMTGTTGNGYDAPTLIFEDNPSIYQGLGAYTVRLKADGHLQIQGQDGTVDQDVAVPPAMLNGGSSFSGTTWNRLTVRVSGSTANFFVNDGTSIASISGTGIAYGEDAGLRIGVTGRNGRTCAFENFWYYQTP